MVKPTTNSLKSGHPIQVAARYTGLSSDLIRAWEKRYHAVQPTRAPNGRRLYSSADIQRLTLLRQVTQFGRRISEVASLSMDELVNIVKSDETALAQRSNDREARLDTSSVMELFEQCFSAVVHLNTNELQATLTAASQELGIMFLLEDLISPLLHHVEEEYRQGELGNCHLRLLTETVRSFLMLLSTQKEAAQDGCVVCSIRKDPLLTALRAAVITNTYGWRPIYLGECVDYYEISEAVETVDAKVVVISFDRSDEDARIPTRLRQLAATLPKQVQLIISAPDACAYSSVLDEEEATHVHNLSELRLEFERLTTNTKGEN